MKISVLTFIMALNILYSVAQVDIYKPVVSDIHDSLFQNSSIAITGRQFTFRSRINDFMIDTTTGNFLIDLRDLTKNGIYVKNKGKTLVYNTLNDSVLWTKKINYGNTKVFSRNGMFFDYSEYLLTRRDLNTWNSLWKIKGLLWFIHPFKPVIYFYDYGYATKRKNEPMTVFHLDSGRELWREKMPKGEFWNSYVYPSDSTMLIASSGLHLFNIFTGKGWSYEAKTTKSDYSGMAVANSIGLVAGIMTGTVMLYTAGPDIISDYASNILRDDSLIWFASREKLACLDYSCKIRWEQTIKQLDISKSFIWEDGYQIYLLNLGYVNAMYHKKSAGKAFLAAFSKNTGEFSYMYDIEKERGFIRDYQISGDTLELLYKDGIEAIDFATGHKLSLKQFDKSLPEEITGMNYRSFYFEDNNGMFRRSDKIADVQYIVTTDKEQILMLDKDLKIIKNLDATELFFSGNLKNPSFRFLYNDSQSFIIDLTGKVRAGIKSCNSPVFIQGKIFYIKDDTNLIQIDNIE